VFAYLKFSCYFPWGRNQKRMDRPMSGDLAITYGIGALPLPPLTEEDLGEAHQQMIEEISTSLARIKKDAPHASAQFERSLVTKLVDIHARLFQLMTGKSSGYAMREEVKRARSEIKSFSDRFVEEYSLFKKDHAREESALDTTIAKIQDLSFDTIPFRLTPDFPIDRPEPPRSLPPPPDWIDLFPDETDSSDDCI
jgi:hypothetical protein